MGFFEQLKWKFSQLTADTWFLWSLVMTKKDQPLPPPPVDYSNSEWSIDPYFGSEWEREYDEEMRHLADEVDDLEDRMDDLQDSLEDSEWFADADLDMDYLSAEEYNS